jgi:hypothetical protein
LLESLHPAAIFSADDHDYCEHIHSYGHDERTRAVREVTVKSISTVTGLDRPGVHLLSLWAPNGKPSASASASASPTYADRVCLLPNQSWIQGRGYFPLTVITLFLLVYVNTTTFLATRRRAGGSPPILASAAPNVLGTPPTPASARTSSALWLRSPTLRPSPPVAGTPSPLALSPVLVPPSLDEDGADGYQYPAHPTLTTNAPPYRRPSCPSPLGGACAEALLVDCENGNVKEQDVEVGVGVGVGAAGRKVSGLGIGGWQQQQQQARRATWGFFSEKDKRLLQVEKLGLGLGRGRGEARTPGLGGGIASLASGRCMALLGTFKRFVVGRPIAGGFWRRLVWDALVVAWPPLLVLGGIVVRLTR